MQFFHYNLVINYFLIQIFCTLTLANRIEPRVSHSAKLYTI